LNKYSFKKSYKKRWIYRYIALSFLLIVAISSIGIGSIIYYNNLNNFAIVKTDDDYNNALKNDNYIKIYADEIYDLDIGITETTSKFGIKINERTKANYIAINVDTKILIVSIPTDKYEEIIKQKSGPYLLQGQLWGIDDNDLEYIKKSLVSKNLSMEKLNSIVHVNYLDYATPLNSVEPFYAVSLILFLVGAICLPIMYKNTTALKRLKKYSNGDIEMAYMQIDNEVNSQDIYENAPLKITQNYLIVETQKITFAMPLKELIWAYKKVTKHKVYGIIPVAKINTLVLVFSDKKKYEIPITKINKNADNVDDIVRYIGNHSNKTFIGYSKELEDLFKKDFEQFIFKWKNHVNDKTNINEENLVNI